MTAMLRNAVELFPETLGEWYEDRAPRLGAALAYYMVFALAPGLIFIYYSAQILFRSGVHEGITPVDWEPGSCRRPEEPAVPISDADSPLGGTVRSKRLVLVKRRQGRTRRRTGGS